MRRLAITKDGRFTYCCSPDSKLGKGRCNHIAVQSENNGTIGESADEFMKRMEEERKKLNMVNIKNISKYDFSLPEDYFDNREKDQVVKEYVHIAAINLRLKNRIKTYAKYFFAKDIEEPDSEKVSEAMKAAYPKKLEFENAMREFKGAHPDWYEKVPCQVTYKPSEEDKVRAQQFVDELDNDDARCFWYFKTKSMLDEYKKFMKDKPVFMTAKFALKAEYKDAFGEYQKEIEEKTGWYGEAAVKKTVTATVPGKKYTQLRAIELNVTASEVEHSDKLYNVMDRTVDLPEKSGDVEPEEDE